MENRVWSGLAPSSGSWACRALGALLSVGLAACSSTDMDAGEPVTEVAALNGTQPYYEAAGTGDAVLLAIMRQWLCK
jgi:hypothetical protein